eukprot:TRINITY_DN2333_c0_g1_i3.p3 TRINITY_DN2333_c0_g1~~TRINITY_DN2333_c0_g1_i3.p3  ORF type:complete len:114 (+),score=19.43 TRINITY_DN2333_c0_g1_i3:438-779(+)
MQAGLEHLAGLACLPPQRAYQDGAAANEQDGEDAEDNDSLFPEGQRHTAHCHDDAQGEQKCSADGLGPERHEAEFLLLQLGDQKLGTRLANRDQRRDDIFQGGKKTFAAFFTA